MKLAVTGGRENGCWYLVSQALAALRSECEALELIVGGARGVDRFAEQWARLNGLPVAVVLPQWHIYGKAAGIVRNREMARMAQGLVSFPGGRGTDHMTRFCFEIGLPVWFVSASGELTVREGTQQMLL